MTELQRAYQIGAWISGGVVNSPVGSGGGWQLWEYG